MSRGDKRAPRDCDFASGGTGNVARMLRLGIAVSLISLVLLAACGGGGNDTSSGGAAPSAGGASGSASTQGKTVFTANCKGCHTLKDADATGSVGPNLDELA